MWWIPLVAVVGVAVTVGAVVGVRRRREVEPSREAALRAIRGLSRDSRRQRGQRARGTGEHFGRTPVKKYSDERQDPSERDTPGGFWSSASDGGSAGGSD